MNRLPHTRFIPALLLCLAGSFTSQRADATIDISPKEVQIRNAPLSVHIINSGDRTEYVSISLRLLKNPGVRIEEETLEAVADIAQPALYAFPFQVTLAPGQSKKIVLKPVRAVDAETVYRLDIKPVIRPRTEDGTEKFKGVIINLSFSALVRQLPPTETDTLKVVCVSDGAELIASGTVRHSITSLHVDGKSESGFNIYPGVPHKVTGHLVEVPGHPPCKSGR